MPSSSLGRIFPDVVMAQFQFLAPCLAGECTIKVCVCVTHLHTRGARRVVSDSRVCKLPAQAEVLKEGKKGAVFHTRIVQSRGAKVTKM